MFLMTFINNGNTKSNAAFDRVVRGVTILSDIVIIGANDAKTISANASAPPNNPILQTMIAKGAIINENNINEIDS
ncbi:MAG: hypothetical protein YK1312THETA_210008 [Marine Group I thaumarchaeote]|nr:MAG: hypothetical protein YK1312THETA_210008 [Marine Group I thaumarchaeote]